MSSFGASVADPVSHHISLKNTMRPCGSNSKHETTNGVAVGLKLRIDERRSLG